MEEQWKVVPGYNGRYEASTQGRIRLINGGKGNNISKILSTWCSNAGYESVKICFNKQKVTKSVHQIVALAFCGLCPEGMEVHHIDGNRINNIPENLTYVSRRYNLDHRDLTKTRRKHYLSVEDIQNILTRIEAGKLDSDIANELEVYVLQVDLIRRTQELIRLNSDIFSCEKLESCDLVCA